MGDIIVPRTGATINGRKPTTEDYVRSVLTTMRANLRRKTVFTGAGRTEIRERGEAILYAPNGDKIRVVELPEGGNQVEHGDHLHAHIRPTVVTLEPRTNN
jgi:hypothetical protein